MTNTHYVIPKKKKINQLLKLQQFKLKTCLKSVFWDVLKDCLEQIALQRKHFICRDWITRSQRQYLSLMKPKVCKDSSAYERDARNSEKCRLNGFQLQIIKDTSARNKRKKLLLDIRWANRQGRHHSSIAFRYVSQISVSSNCYLKVDVFQLWISLPFCLDWSLASFLQLMLSFWACLKIKGFFFIS